jgi:hypothetical protein
MPGVLPAGSSRRADRIQKLTTKTSKTSKNPGLYSEKLLLRWPGNHGFNSMHHPSLPAYPVFFEVFVVQLILMASCFGENTW